MGNEYMIKLAPSSEDPFSASDKVTAIFRAEGETLTITAKEEDVLDRWGAYAENDPIWKEHAKTDAPLSSLFGRSGYNFGEWFPYNDETKAAYDKAVKDFGGVTKSFKPKGD